MKILTLSRNYPNTVLPHLGVWVEGLVAQLAKRVDVRVVSPVPYAPPFPNGVLQAYTRFRSIPKRESRGGVTIDHPRFVITPGNYLYAYEADLMLASLRPVVERVRREFRFDLIHAHFSYPDGVVAAKLAAHYGVPFVITEHALWHPWMDKNERVRRQAVAAIEQCFAFIAASRALRDSMTDFAGHAEKCRLIPIGVDAAIFHAQGRAVKQGQILYVGRFQPVKGVDVLLRAFHRCTARQQGARLVLVGGSLYNSKEERDTRELAQELQLTDQVEFRGALPPEQVAQAMRESAFLVSPSRRESFGTVLAEALACGTPVLATRCGGPEDIVNDEVGRLVAPDDVDALAAGLDDMFARAPTFDPAALSNDALSRYRWDMIAEQVIGVYHAALNPTGEG